jgi:carboxymethylenebutenolidase
MYKPAALTLRVPDAFIRDELSKGRYDAALSGVCFEMLKELFNRTLRSDLGPASGEELKVEDVC